MDFLSIMNLLAFGVCSFGCGVNLANKNYGWAAVEGGLAVLNFAVAWL